LLPPTSLILSMKPRSLAHESPCRSDPAEYRAIAQLGPGWKCAPGAAASATDHAIAKKLCSGVLAIAVGRMRTGLHLRAVLRPVRARNRLGAALARLSLAPREIRAQLLGKSLRPACRPGLVLFPASHRLVRRLLLVTRDFHTRLLFIRASAASANRHFRRVSGDPHPATR